MLLVPLRSVIKIVGMEVHTILAGLAMSSISLLRLLEHGEHRPKAVVTSIVFNAHSLLNDAPGCHPKVWLGGEPRQCRVDARIVAR